MKLKYKTKNNNNFFFSKLLLSSYKIFLKKGKKLQIIYLFLIFFKNINYILKKKLKIGSLNFFFNFLFFLLKRYKISKKNFILNYFDIYLSKLNKYQNNLKLIFKLFFFFNDIIKNKIIMNV